MAKKTSTIKYYEAVGRRKEAVARVRLYLTEKTGEVAVTGQKLKKGEIVVNKKPIANIFSLPFEKIQYLKPLKLTESENRFAISVVIRGGGHHGQLEALVHGLSRALEKVDTTAYRLLLKKEGLLTRDARVRERRKVGRGGKARKAKQSPKR